MEHEIAWDRRSCEDQEASSYWSPRLAIIGMGGNGRLTMIRETTASRLSVDSIDTNARGDMYEYFNIF